MNCFAGFLPQNNCTLGRQFESELIEEICKLLEIRKSRTTPYHPQGNGMVERFNRTILDMLATTAHNHPSDWDLYIRKVCLAYNSSIHSSTGFSPFFLMFGREVKLPIDLMYGSNPIEQTTLPEYVQKLKDGLEKYVSQTSYPILSALKSTDSGRTQIKRDFLCEGSDATCIKKNENSVRQSCITIFLNALPTVTERR